MWEQLSQWGDPGGPPPESTPEAPHRGKGLPVQKLWQEVPHQAGSAAPVGSLPSIHSSIHPSFGTYLWADSLLIFWLPPVSYIVLNRRIRRVTLKPTSAPSATTASALNPGSIHHPKAIYNRHITCPVAGLCVHSLFRLIYAALSSTRRRVRETPGSFVKQRAVGKDSRARMPWKSIKETFTQVGPSPSLCLQYARSASIPFLHIIL